MVCDPERLFRLGSPAFVSSCLVPQGEFDTVAYSNLVIDLAEVVSDNMFANSQVLSDFAILQSLSHQLDHSKLASARRPSAVSVNQPFLDGQCPPRMGRAVAHSVTDRDGCQPSNGGDGVASVKSEPYSFRWSASTASLFTSILMCA
jgi:hypothetical protein